MTNSPRRVRMTGRRRETLGDVMDRHGGLGPGFDFMRLFLALSVLLLHSFQVNYGVHWNAGFASPAFELIVPAFFAISGFLVAGSAIRTRSVRTFLVFRALRIMPALTVEVTISALILGPLVTTLPLRDYVQGPEFAAYFGNMIGWIHYHLPGVYLDNPISGIVDGQLWTIPIELHCYVILAVLMICGLVGRPVIMAGILIAGSAYETATLFSPAAAHITSHVIQGAPVTLVLCFFCGNVFYIWRRWIPLSFALFALSLIGFALVVAFVPCLSFLVGVPAATYLITYLGLQRIPRVPLIMNGDYSYGTYLYSFSLQQAIVWLMPSHRVWWVNLLIALPLTIAVAAFSWHVVEKRFLKLRKWLAPRAAIPRPVLDEGWASRSAAGARTAAGSLSPTPPVTGGGTFP